MPSIPPQRGRPSARRLARAAGGTFVLALALALALGLAFALGRRGPEPPIDTRSDGPPASGTEAEASPRAEPLDFKRPPQVRATDEPTRDAQLSWLRARRTQATADARREFPPELARQPLYASQFAELAETSSDADEVAAALRAAALAYGARSSRKAAPDAALDRALQKHLGSEQGRVAALAFEAARAPLLSETPSSDLLATLTELSRPPHSLAQRLAALTALNLLRPNLRPERVIGAFVDAVAAEDPSLVSVGLLGLIGSQPSFEGLPLPEQQRVATLVGGRLGDSDPGVRGRALETLTRLSVFAGEPGLLIAALTSLGDTHAYVRTVACDVLMRRKDPQTFEALLPLVKDQTPASYELPVPGLDGPPTVLAHRVPGRPRVADGALYALQALSQTIDGPPLLLHLGGPQESAESLARAEQAVVDWMSQVRGLLPPQRVPK